MAVAPCRNFASKGTCPFENRCRFSHDREGRTDRPPPEQTPCFHWEESGSCPYGSRCAYLHRHRAPRATKALYDGLCEKLHTFGSTKSRDSREVTAMTNLQEIASYDWLAATFQTIGVPGNPRKLSPPEMPLTLRPDAIVFNKGSGGGTATDPYRFRLEAPLQACLQQHPLISFGHIDVICGLNNLRKLFDFASGKRGNAFRIDIETCGEVLIMTRWESDPKNLTQTSLCRGYGRGFEEACTTQGNLEVDSTSHHRVISYSLGRLNILLQHEVDACDCQCLEQDGKDNTSPTPQHQAWNAAPARLPPSMVDSSDSSAMPLVVVDHGTRHSSACLVEIKSRDKKNARKDDIMVQMWLSGCHRLFLGRHLRGRFVSTDVYQEDITSDIGNWQADHENEISDFVRLLELIRQTVCEAASKAGSGRYALICARGRAEKQLELWRREGGQDMLRQETLSRVQVVPNIAGLDIKTL